MRLCFPTGGLMERNGDRGGIHPKTKVETETEMETTRKTKMKKKHHLHLHLHLEPESDLKLDLHSGLEYEAQARKVTTRSSRAALLLLVGIDRASWDARVASRWLADEKHKNESESESKEAIERRKRWQTGRWGKWGKEG